MKSLAAILLLLATSAGAAERGFSVTDFDRIRVDGPYKVTLTTGRSPGARAFGSQGAIDGVAVDIQGRTLTIKRSSQSWGGYPGKSAGPVEIRVSTNGLRSAQLNGAGSLGIDRIKGQSIELVVSGSGLLKVASVEADRLSLGVAGSGRAEIAGRVAIAQIAVRGTGDVEGEKLIVKDVKIAADGPGSIRITATATAAVASNGSGDIVVLGDPACTVTASGSGTVACGD